MISDPKVRHERVHVLVASVTGPQGRAEVRFLCDPCTTTPKFVVRMEQKKFQDLNVLQKDFAIGLEPPLLDFQKAVQIAKDKVR